MKIALVDPSMFTWPYDSALRDGLRLKGHDVTLYTKYMNNGESGKDDAGVKEIFYPYFQLPFFKKLPKALFLTLKGLMHPISMLRLATLLKHDKPDVIHFQWMPLPAIDRFFIPLFRRIAPIVLTVHDSTPFNDNPSSALQRAGAIAIMRRFDALIVHTESARKKLVGYGLPAIKVNAIHHGLLALPPAPDVARDPKDERITVLLFGQLKPYKGVDVLIRALGAMPSEARKLCHVKIVGRPMMDVQPAQNLVQQLGLKDSVTFDLRFVPEVEIAGIMQAADILVFPYREIDASGVLMLALGLNKPIVASRIGLFAEMLVDGRHGYLVSPNDPVALSGALAELVRNGDRRRSSGEAVKSLAQSIPSWEQIATTTEAMYEYIKR